MDLIKFYHPIKNIEVIREKEISSRVNFIENDIDQKMNR